MPLTLLILMLKINLWIVVQGPANQAHVPAVQNQAQGPAVQNQVQGPVNNNAQVGQIYPCNHHNNWPQHNQSPQVW